MKKIKDTNPINKIVKRASLVAGALALSLGIIAFNYKNTTNEDPSFVKYTDYYKGSQAHISDPNLPAASTSYISMTDAADNGSVTNQTITISSPEELILFSTTCNSTSAFLGYNYVLSTNIELTTEYNFIPVGWNGTPFSGTFNGQGYDITGLRMTLNSTSGYSDMKYFSMFSKNTGTITNLGMVSPTVITPGTPLSDWASEGGVSVLVGENSGTVSNSFIVDDVETDDHTPGITSTGSRVATLCVANKGTLNNNYVLINSVLNPQITDIIEFTEISLSNTNTGTITNNFYYNNSILSYNNGTIEYKESYNYDSKSNQTIGTYCATPSALVSALHTEDSTWFIPSDYGDLSRYVGIKYAIRRGISTYDNSSKTLTISTPKDFAYMYELFNADDYMASNAVTYNITNNLDLSLIPTSAYIYDKAIGATITGTSTTGIPTLINGQTSAYPTIYNADIMNSDRVVTSTGVDCYGLFNYLTGTVSNLNIVSTSMDLNDVDNSNNNFKGIGVLSGYIEGGSVDNVNIYATFTNSTNKDIGEHYIGGLCGVLGGEAQISNITTAGSMTFNSTSHTIPSTSSYMKGIAIGGVVGYIEDSSGAVYNCLNAANITCKAGTSTDYAIGGVIGAGYTMNYGKDASDNVIRTSQLENTGNISVCDESNHTYSTLYVSGIIGRHFGMIDQVEKFTNNGNISVYTNGNETYVSGVENADIIREATANTHRYASKFKNTAGNTLFYASSLSNGGEVKITGGSGTNLEYTNVLNIKAGNGVKSEVSGIYNLAYYQKYSGTTTKSKTALTDQSIDMNVVTKFIPALNVVGGTSDYTTKATTVYNLRNVNYSLSSAISSATTFNYTGVASGEYVTYQDIRNEGNLTFTFGYGVSSASNLYVSGLFNELSLDSKAYLLFNGGNITFTDSVSTDKNITIYASGICYEIKDVINDNEQNPLSDDFDSSLKGSLDTAINDGDIHFESSYINTSTKFNSTQTSYFSGNLYFSGISYKNAGIISNTFNLGDLFAGTIAQANKYFQLAGITNINTGAYAQIRDCANNGEIKNINIFDGTAYIRSSGITITNDNESQIIAFTINYGAIYSFINHTKEKRAENATKTVTAQASGILTEGVCNTVNVVNYGNVFSNENAGGIVAKFNQGLYSSSPAVIIANTLNYANVKAINNYVTVAGSPSYATYQEMVDLTESDTTYIRKGYEVDRQYIGAIIGISNYNGKNNFTIRYLINFAEGIAVVCSEYNSNNLTTDVTKMFNVESDLTTNAIMNGHATYAPLSADVIDGNIGIFNSNFVFRLAIEGTGLDSNYVTDKYLNNFFQFIPFEKVSDSIIEKIGWTSIAYQAAAEEFMTDLDKVVTLLNTTSSATSNYSSLITDATSSSSWISTCNTTIIRNLFEKAISANNLTNAELLSVIEYVLFTADSKSGISLTYRQEIISLVLDYLEAQSIDYYDVLNTLLYDELLAKIVSGSTTDYAAVQTTIKNIIDSKSSSDLQTLVETYLSVLDTNPEVLDPLFEDYSTEYLQTKINVLTTLLEGFSSDELTKIYASISGISADSDIVKYYTYLLNNESIARNIYTNIIAQSGNEEVNDFVTAMNKALKQYNVGSMIEDYSIDSDDSDYNSTLSTNFNNALTDEISNTNYTAAETTADYTSTYYNVTSLNITPTKDYVSLWNTIKNSSTLQSYLNSTLDTVTSVDSVSGKGIYAVATEYTNSYQTLDAPAGTDNGLTMKNTGILRIEDGTDVTTKINNRFIYTPDDVVSYGTHFYGPYTTKDTNTTWVVGAQNRYLTIDDTGTASAVSIKYMPVYIGLDESTLYNKISSTTNPTIYEFIWNDFNKNSSKYQWVSKIILDKQANDSTSFLYNLYTDGDTYTYGTDTVTTDYIKYGYDFNPDLNRCVSYDRLTPNTLPAGDYSYTNLATGKTVSQNLESKEANLVTNGADGDTFSNHKYRAAYLTGYVSASLITGIYYQHNIWFTNNAIQGVFLTAKENNDGKVNYNGTTYMGVQTTAYINYFLDDLINLDGVRTKGMSDDRVSWDESNIINALMTQILSTNAGENAVLHALAEVSVNGIDDISSLMILLKSIDLSTIAFPYNSVLGLVSTADASTILTTLGGYTNLKAYLDSLLSGTSYSVKDQIIQLGSVDRTAFITILKEAYEYSKYSELYKDYELSKTIINDYIYTYVSELIDSEDDATITSILQSISDSDLTYITNLFENNDATNVYYEEYEDDDFYISNITIYNNEYENYSTIFDSTYTRAIVAGTDGSELSFEVDDYEYGYDIEIVMNGSVTYDGTVYSSTSLNANESESIYIHVDPYTYLELNISEGTKIYAVNIYSAANAAGYSTEKTYLSTYVGPFASTTSSISNNRYSVTHSTSGQSIVFNMNSYTTTIDSVNLSFTAKNSSNSKKATISVNGTQVGSNIGTSEANLTASSISITDGITISIVTSDTDNSKSVYISNVVITYVYKITNSDNSSNQTTITYAQNVIKSTSSTHNVVNSNSNCGLDVSGGLTKTYTFNTDTNTTNTGVGSAITYKPWYYKYNEAHSRQLVNSFDISAISMKDSSAIGNAFASNYENLSEYAKYLLSGAIIESESTSSFTLTEDAFVLIKAKSSVDVTETDYVQIEVTESTYSTLSDLYIYNSSTSSYELDESGTFNPDETYYQLQYINTAYIQVNGITNNLTNDYVYYIYELSADTYTIYGSNFSVSNIYIINKDNVVTVSTSGTTNTITFNNGNETTTLFSADYSQMANFDIDTVIPTALDGKTKYETFVTVYPYYYCNRTNPVTNRLNDLRAIVTYLYPSIVNTSSTPNKWFTFDYDTYSIFTETQVKSLIISIAALDCDDINSAFGKLITMCSSNYTDILKYIVGYSATTLTDAQEASLIDALIKIQEISNTKSYTNIIKYYIAAYVGNDFLEKSDLSQLTSTIVYTLLTNYSSSTYNFITSDSTVDGNTFKSLLKHLGYSTSSNNTYGIYALSSSEGIGYGIFIPDNMDLSILDAPYETDSTLNVLVLQSSNSAEWRGGETISEGTSGTVDYAFYHDMKQLKKSISTNVFELNLNDDSIKSVDDQINNASGEIIYYVSYADFNTLYNSSSVTISSYELASSATLSTPTISSTGDQTISLTGDNVTKTLNTSIVITNAFTVYAEDTSVYKSYTVKFILAAPTNITVDVTPASITYSGGTVTATVTGSNFIDGMDLEPYISILVNSTSYSTTKGYWKLDPSVANNAIVNNNTATIVLIIDSSLPGGEVTVSINIFGQSGSDTFTKTKNNAKAITEFGFDGELLTISASMSSTIPFGRAYDYSELTDYTSSDFYLYTFKYSENATVSIIATKTINSKGLMVYTVTYTITPEDDSAASTYIHTLTENQFFNDNDTYANIYADGEAVSTTDSYSTLDELDRPKYLSDGTLTYSLSEDTYDSDSNSWSLTDGMFAQVSFNRGIEPQYRIKYNLSNFYTLGDNVVWAPTTATSENGATVNNTYAGLTVTVSDNNDTGEYTFVYTYTNTGTWVEDGENATYTRYYEFPEFVIVKMASTDALLHQLTFLEEYIEYGNTATVILPTTVMVPDKSGTASTYESSDSIYTTEFEKTSRDIVVSTKKINYYNSSADSSVTDYYAIGTVSDADLSYYCPTFSVNDYAQMYQYTTLTKLTSYGTGVQTATDKTILSNHDDMYLYVPFKPTSGVDVVFLVKVEEDGYWSDVYTTEFNGTNASSTLVGTFTADTVNANNATVEGIIDGYRVCDYAGSEVDNQSLFMDYIGTPLAGHFWYVSYVIFSEDKLTGGTNAGNVRYYHISIIDTTNTIQFNVTVYTDTTLTLSDIYLTISENIYKESSGTYTYTSTRQISAYAVDSEGTYSGSRTDIAGYKIYNLRFSLQTLPKGYFYFYIDLPDGYVAVAYTDMTNQLDTESTPGSSEEGSFLPYTSIITQKVALEIDVHVGEGALAGAWAVNTTDIYTKQATYSGTIPAES